MNATALAEQFNVIGRQLEAGDHRLIMRQARALLEAEAMAEALDFLRSAEQRHSEVGPLAEGLQSYMRSGGQALVLVAEQAWRSGCDQEQRVERQIQAATSQRDLGALLSVAVKQSRDLAEGRPYQPIEQGPIALETPPPAPRDEGLMTRDIHLPELEDEGTPAPRPGAVATPIGDQPTPMASPSAAHPMAPSAPEAPVEQKPGISGKVVVAEIIVIVALGYLTVKLMLEA